MKYLISGLIAALLTSLTLDVQAQSRGFSGLYKDRAGRMEVTIGANNTAAWGVRGDRGAELDVKANTGWAFSLGYNFDNHWNLTWATDYNDAKYSATVVNEDDDSVGINHKLSTYNSQFNGTYNFFEGAFTPYVQAGLGWSYIDSNISGPPQTGCWWTWYGYVCSSYYNSYGTNEFSYSLGAGVRYEFNRNLFVKAGYTSMWLDSSEDIRYDIGRLELGFML
ncbi:hypothetical protein R50072_12580 [Simiduia litorea]|uniref:outer membrane protein n=1 Tax=Simiduia litorea TaxID=1435348 RepID=UPI0036F22BF9